MTYPEAMVERVQALYDDGHTQREIAQELSLTQKIVWRLMKVHEITARPPVPRNQRGAANNNWRGSDITYSAGHYRVSAARGTPSHCSACDSTDDQAYEWANLTGRFDDPLDYVRMCMGCHRRFDARRRR